MNLKYGINGDINMLGNENHIEIPEDTIEKWQEIVDIMAEIINIPAGLIMRLKEPYIEVFVSSESEGNPYQPGDKEEFWDSGLYCETVIKSKDKLMVPNALRDENWKNNPDIKLNMVSYLGFPILLPDGNPFGTICVLDIKENSYSDNYEKLIQKFRNIVQSDLQLIYMNKILGDKNRQLIDYIEEIKTLRGLIPICSYCKSIRGDNGNWNSIEYYLSCETNKDLTHSICPECAKKYYPDINLYDDL